MKAAIYARVSRIEQNQDTENQLIQLRQYADSKKYEIIEEYVEEITGTGKKDRPKLNDMMEDARHRRFDILLVWSYDRFSRAGLKDLALIMKLNDYGVKFFSFQESFLDTTSEIGELILPIFAWVAKQEAKKISERTKAGLERLKLKHKDDPTFRLGRPGIEFDIRKAKEMRNSGMSWRAIARELNVSHPLVIKRLKNPTSDESSRNKTVMNRSDSDQQKSNVDAPT